ncbi:hypothetical protein PTKIN_Ptkin02bG0229900 [Pterospermum kingtungense]
MDKVAKRNWDELPSKIMVVIAERLSLSDRQVSNNDNNNNKQLRLFDMSARKDIKLKLPNRLQRTVSKGWLVMADCVLLCSSTPESDMFLSNQVSGEHRFRPKTLQGFFEEIAFTLLKILRNAKTHTSHCSFFARDSGVFYLEDGRIERSLPDVSLPLLSKVRWLTPILKKRLQTLGNEILYTNTWHFDLPIYLWQAALEKGKNLEAVADEIKKEDLHEEDLDDGSESVKSLTSQMTDLAVSQNPVVSSSPPSNSVEASDAGAPVQDLDKKIRALKKKIRLAEAQQQKTPQQDMKPEQLEKLAKMEGWREELKLLEDKKAELAAL